ncbi:hypothetical protein N9048_02225, partial [bacterium]|nr:hypothetical protein [bacterium]
PTSTLAVGNKATFHLQSETLPTPNYLQGGYQRLAADLREIRKSRSTFEDKILEPFLMLKRKENNAMRETPTGAPLVFGR